MTTPRRGLINTMYNVHASPDRVMFETDQDATVNARSEFRHASGEGHFDTYHGDLDPAVWLRVIPPGQF